MIDETNETEKPEVVQETPDKDLSDKLSTRAALEKAFEEKGGRQQQEPRSEKTASEPTRTEVKAAVEADLEPPSEFSIEAKKAWKAKDLPAIQREYARIHTARTQEISRAQQAEREAREDAKTWRELGKMAAPYIEARGQEGVTPQQAMMEALALIQEFKKGDPASVKAELKKIGIDLDAAPGQKIDSSTQAEKDALQKRLESVEAVIEEQKLQRTVQSFETVFTNLASQKTRTGDPVFPDLFDSSETGQQFARDIGSLTQDKRFQTGVLRRFPTADLTILVREAYKYLGGKVSGEPVQVSTETQTKHVEKSRRAAASTPGGLVRRNGSRELIGKLSNRAALEKAWEEREH